MTQFHYNTSLYTLRNDQIVTKFWILHPFFHFHGSCKLISKSFDEAWVECDKTVMLSINNFPGRQVIHCVPGYKNVFILDQWTWDRSLKQSVYVRLAEEEEDAPRIMVKPNLPERWLHNWISYPNNWSKQIQETRTAYSANTQTRQSLNEKQRTWLQDDNCLSVKPCMLFFIQTLPCRPILCVSAISRASFLDLFGPTAGVNNLTMQSLLRRMPQNHN